MASNSGRRTTRQSRRETNAEDSNELRGTLGLILERLSALEGQGAIGAGLPPPPGPAAHDAPAEGPSAVALPPPPPLTPVSHFSMGGTDSSATTVDPTADRIIGALSALTKVRSTQYYISNFDPKVNDIDSWCIEVDRARDANNWEDNECLSRIAHCLKGDARCWLNEWVTNDRTWSNFKREFKALCPRRIDVANILFEVMCTTSEKYATYAEYARRSLLRLNIVKGLSDELIVAIVIRGIKDPQIRAAATNAKLLPNNLVEFLSIYVKPVNHASHSRDPVSNRPIEQNPRKRSQSRSDLKCYSCGNTGHVQRFCSKKPKVEPKPDISTVPAKVTVCTFCKKPGHVVDKCFAKQRSESRNKNEVNLCRELEGSSKDVTSAVIQGIPIDVLIDSGSCVSLISESALKHFDWKRVPSYQVLKGIGNQNVESTFYVTLVIEFSEISLEVDLIVVPDNCMSVPVLLGTDVLNRDGVKYVRTGSEQRLTRASESESDATVLHVQTNAPQINTPLVGADREKLLLIIDEFSDSFIVGTAVSTVTTGTMSIRLTSDTPVYYRPYKLSHDEKLRVRLIIHELLEKSIIRESESAYASPIILVKKKDGSDRLCVDYRALNAITIKERFPMPLIEDQIDRLGKSRYFSCIDMATGFHQLLLEEDSTALTAFVTPEGHFEYLKMPYGLANAPVVYQRVISKTLRKHLDSGKALVYVDDVLILASTVEEALKNLREVLATLTSAGFSINIKKSTFITPEVEYLGRVISQGQVKPSVGKIQALVESPIPTNVKQVRQLLGLAGYFRRYIRDYASKTTPISRLTRNGVPFVWGEQQESARRYLIDCLTNEPVLAIFDPNLPTELHTDASSVGYGAVLIQEHEGKRRRVVAYFSKTTQGAEPRYHSYELETLAVIKALQSFRHYLLGVQFKIVTDCNALKLTERKKDLLPRVARWWMYMQDFTFTIEYRKGTLMSHADYLSRNPVEVRHITKPKSWAQIAQSADDETKAMIDKVNNNELDSTRYVVQGDLLYYRYSPLGEEVRLLCFIPKGHRLSLLRIFHDQHQHIGADKTIELILRHFWFPGLRAFVKKYVSHCVTCLASKRIPRAPLQPITSWVKPDVPFSVIHVDALGPLSESKGNKYVLILVDSFTKYCLLYPMRKQDANELKIAFSNALSLFGTPKMAVVDKGRMFESASFKNWLSEMECSIHFITPEVHNENGQVERYCRTVLNMLRIEATNNSTWSDTLWKMQLILNCTQQKSTKVSPLQLLVGIDGATPIIRSIIRDVAIDNVQPNREAVRELRRQRASDLLDSNRQKQDERVNKNRKLARTYKVNDFAFVIKVSQMTGKMDSGMRGPYKVTKVLPYGRYQLRLLGGSYGKSTQASVEYMVPWRGEWTPDVCSAFFLAEDSEDAQAGCSTSQAAPMDEHVHPSGEAVLAPNSGGRGVASADDTRISADPVADATSVERC